MSKRGPGQADMRKFIVEFFHDGELDTFCFDYFSGIKQEFTRGMEKSQKVILLLEYCQRRGLAANLRQNLAQERPEAYDQRFGRQPLALAAVLTQPRNPDFPQPRSPGRGAGAPAGGGFGGGRLPCVDSAGQHSAGGWMRAAFLCCC